jgi:hypothetical protein
MTTLLRLLAFVAPMVLCACHESPPPAKVTDEDVRRYIKKQHDDEPGRAFEHYVDSHFDTPNPAFKLPEIPAADPTMWDWTVRTFFLHEKRMAYWTDPPGTAFPIVSSTVLNMGIASGALPMSCTNGEITIINPMTQVYQ